MYVRYCKRFLDVIVSIFALIVFMPLMAVMALLVRTQLGAPVIFKQVRPGLKGPDGREKLFILYKFRSMTNEKDANGDLLPDDARLTKFGQWLRATSIDELPELINILKGDMSIVGPRPLLVRDMVFMTDEQRMRHDIRPGLTGWAQINGRNYIEWQDKLKLDLEYIRNQTFFNDLRILFLTIIRVFKSEGIRSEGMLTAEDYGDCLLRTGSISMDTYREKQNEAIRILDDFYR